MELAMSAIGIVLPRLAQLLTDEYQLQGRVKKDIQSLERELAAIHVALEEVAKVPWDELKPGIKLWASNARELSYNIDDALDRFFVRTAGHDHEPAGKGLLKKLARKTRRLINKGKARHEIAGAISDIRELAKEVAELRERYKVDGLVANHAARTIDPRIKALHKDMAEVVGIDEARDEVANMLSGHNDELKVVSIVGFGGLGKTTLARAVHDRLNKEQFRYRAFVSVGQNPDLKKVFKDTLYGLDADKYKDIHNTTMEENLLIGMLRNFLEDKRYFVIIDDLWDEKVWEVIECAFYKNNLGSRIIITTRNVVVSKACCSNDDAIYRMKPLSGDDSKRLFYKRIFHHENGCPGELEEVSKDILKKCGGVPLAIITIAGLLANKQAHRRDEWYNVLNSIGHGLKGGHQVEDMKKILSFSYYDLPPHLKTCLLYLSIFPEDHEIDRDYLVRIWIAEGVMGSPTSQQENMLVDLGESYFLDLINRSMIQPAERTGLDVDNVISCRVHDMVLELILSLSKEENFVTMLDYERDTSLVGKVHRLCLQNSKAVHTVPDATVRKVRSLYAFSSSIDIMPAVSSFPILRVLDIKDCHFEGSYHLKYLGKLFHLRYLRLSCRCIKELPMEIGNLEFLQTLDLIGSSIKELPPTIVRLRRLMFLRFENAITLSDRIGALTSLQELSPVIDIVDFPGSLGFLKALGNLTELRELAIIFPSNVLGDKVLFQSLCSLRNLREVYLYTRYMREVVLEPMQELCAPPPHLRILYLRVRLSALPLWFNSPLDLQYLSHLEINIDEMHQEDVENLGRLPALRVLKMWIFEAKERLVIASGAFPCLEDCFFRESTFGVVFKSGAMPMVEVRSIFVLVRQCRDINFDCGLGNLPSLRQGAASIITLGAQDWEVVEVEKVLRLIQQTHPNRPYIGFLRSETAEDIADFLIDG
ncbi:hypothetical protein ACP70R_040937 [Stipagrostis hirtigluma subsp. patula]